MHIRWTIGLIELMCAAGDGGVADASAEADEPRYSQCSECAHMPHREKKRAYVRAD